MNDPQLEPQWRYGDLREWLRETEKLGEIEDRPRRLLAGKNWLSFRRGDSKRRGPGGYF